LTAGLDQLTDVFGREHRRVHPLSDDFNLLETAKK